MSSSPTASPSRADRRVAQFDASPAVRAYRDGANQRVDENAMDTDSGNSSGGGYANEKTPYGNASVSWPVVIHALGDLAHALGAMEAPAATGVKRKNDEADEEVKYADKRLKTSSALDIEAERHGYRCATEAPEIIEQINNKFEKAHLAGLAVATTDSGRPVIWGRVRHSLTWSFASNFPQSDIQALFSDINASFQAWEDACDVDFSHVTRNGFFRVRWATDAEEIRFRGVIAMSFFPGQGARDIILFQVFRSQGNRTGILTHEIGHTLGFRHEHIFLPRDPRIPAGETTDGARLITDADRHSVMNYSQLYDDETAHRRTVLSPLDKLGARMMYGAPSNAANFLM